MGESNPGNPDCFGEQGEGLLFWKALMAKGVFTVISVVLKGPGRTWCGRFQRGIRTRILTEVEEALKYAVKQAR